MSGDFSGSGDVDNATMMMMMNFTCLQRNLRGPIMLPYAATLATIMRSIQIIVYIIVFFSSLFLNSLVIVLVAKYKKLQTRSFAIALQVMVLNLIFTLTVYLLRPITAIANEWLFGEEVCAVMAYINLTVVTIRAFLMLTFVVDRFLLFFFPFTYPKKSSKVMIVLCVLTWVVFAAFRVIPFPGLLDCYGFLPTSHVCAHLGRCSRACGIFSFTFIGLIFGPATILPIILYAVLYCRAMRIKKQLSRSDTRTSRILPRGELKATSTFFLLLMAVFILTTPSIIPPLVILNINLQGPSPILYVVSVSFQLLASFRVVADPIVIMRHRDVRDIIRDFYKKISCSQYRIVERVRRKSVSSLQPSNTKTSSL